MVDSVFVFYTENLVLYEVCISAATVAGTGDSQSCQDCFTREGSMSYTCTAECVSCFTHLHVQATQSFGDNIMDLYIHLLCIIIMDDSLLHEDLVVIVLLQLHRLLLTM